MMVMVTLTVSVLLLLLLLLLMLVVVLVPVLVLVLVLVLFGVGVSSDQWCTSDHLFDIYFSVSTDDPVITIQMVHNFSFQAVNNAFFAVDSFFFLR